MAPPASQSPPTYGSAGTVRLWRRRLCSSSARFGDWERRDRHRWLPPASAAWPASWRRCDHRFGGPIAAFGGRPVTDTYGAPHNDVGPSGTGTTPYLRRMSQQNDARTRGAGHDRISSSPTPGRNPEAVIPAPMPVDNPSLRHVKRGSMGTVTVLASRDRLHGCHRFTFRSVSAGDGNRRPTTSKRWQRSSGAVSAT